MHELALAEDILNKVKDEAKKKEISKVEYVKIRVGEARVHDPPELIEIFSTISSGSIADGAQLEVKISPLKASCANCGKEFDSKTPRLDCPHCGSSNIQISSGKELIIEALK